MRTTACAVLAALVCPIPCVLHASAATAPACHGVLSIQDARQIAASVPNARAFMQNQHAALTTALAGPGRHDSVRIRVVATPPGAEPVDVGVYTVNLHTGAVLDDDQEPADDEATRQEELRLLSRLCRR